MHCWSFWAFGIGQQQYSLHHHYSCGVLASSAARDDSLFSLTKYNTFSLLFLRQLSVLIYKVCLFVKCFFCLFSVKYILQVTTFPSIPNINRTTNCFYCLDILELECLKALELYHYYKHHLACINTVLLHSFESSSTDIHWKMNSIYWNCKN